MALALEETHHVFDLMVRNKGAMDAADAPARRHVQHVALAQQLLRPLLAQDGAAVDLARHLEADAGGEVGLDGAGDHVNRRALRGGDQVNTRRARHLRQALDGAFDLLARDHHQVGHFIDHHHDEGHGLEFQRLVLIDGLAGLAVEAGLDGALQHFALVFGLGDALVEGLDAAHAHLGHFAVALFHFPHRPFQRHHRLLGIGDDRRQQMRNAVIDRQFQHLGVDHDQAALFRRQPVEQRQDHGVEADRFARAGGARHQQMRHLGEVGHHRLAADGLAQRQGQRRAGLFVIARRQQFTQVNGFANLVGQLDADDVAARNHGDARRHRAHRAGDVVGQRDHAAGFHACRRLELVQRHHRAGAHGGDAALDAEIGQHRFQHAGILFQRLVGEAARVLYRHRLGQQVQGRKLVFAAAQVQRRLLALFGGGGLARRLALDAAFAALGQAAGRHRLAVAIVDIFLRIILAEVIAVIVLVIRVRLVALIVFVRTAAEIRNPQHSAQPDHSGGNIGESPRQRPCLQPGGKERKRQPHRQQHQRHHEGQPGGAPDQSRMGGKAARGDADQPARARRQRFRRRQHAQARRHGHGAQRPGHRPPHGVFQRAPHHRPRAPRQQRRQRAQRGEAEALQQQVGGHRAERAHPVGGLAAVGVVDAGIAGVIAEQRQQRRRRRQQQRQSGAAQDENPHQPRQRPPRFGHGVVHGATTGAG